LGFGFRVIAYGVALEAPCQILKEVRNCEVTVGLIRARGNFDGKMGRCIEYKPMGRRALSRTKVGGMALEDNSLGGKGLGGAT